MNKQATVDEAPQACMKFHDVSREILFSPFSICGWLDTNSIKKLVRNNGESNRYARAQVFYKIKVHLLEFEVPLTRNMEVLWWNLTQQKKDWREYATG